MQPSVDQSQVTPAVAYAQEPTSMQYRTYLLSFFLSGAAGLIYQIVWIRILSLVFGNTLYAISMVVAGFLSGLALGSHFWGKRADKYKDPIKIYIKLEIWIALSALAVTALVYALDSAIVTLMTVESINSGVWQLARYGLLFIILIAPTSFMGATMPLMTKIVVKSLDSAGRGIASLYAANTYGGMAGCFISGFLMVPLLGVRGTLAVALLLNFSVAGLLWFVGRTTRPAERGTEKNERKPVSKRANKKRSKKSKKVSCLPEQSTPIHRIPLALALTLIALSGFAALAFEILWTRAFIVSFKSTVYLFSNLLTVFLFGMALGSHLSGRWLDKLSDPLKLFGLAQVAIGLLGILSVLFFAYSSDITYGISAMLGGMNWVKDILAMLALMTLVFLIPTALLGLSYPLICRITIDSLGYIGKKVGMVYAIGTFGGILGSLSAGFLILPLLGLQKGIFVVSFIALVTGYIALLNASSRKEIGWVLPASAAFVLIFFVAFEISGTDIGIGAKTKGKIIFSREGITGTVKVIQEVKKGPLSLLVNSYKLATSGDVAVRFGHIPLLLKPDAEDLLLISLGSGITAGSVAAHPVKRIEAVEIVPTLLDVQPLFAKENRNVLADKRFHLTFWDGRHYIRVTKRKYDLVISDLFQPDSAGVGSLYTLEHFLNVKVKLKKGGAMAQWLPMYQLSPENLKIIMRTFAQAFDHVVVWGGDINSELPALMLFGSSEPIRIQPEKLALRLELDSVKKDMIEHADPLSFLSFYIMDRRGIMSFTDGSPINSDNRPVIEYSAPRNIWNRKENAVINFASLIKRRQNVAELLPGAFDDQTFSESLERYYKGRTELLIGKVEHSRRNYRSELMHFQEAAKLIPNDPYLSMAVFDLGYLYYSRGDYKSSSKIFQWSKQLNRELLEAHFYLAKSYERLGMKEASINTLNELARLKPDMAGALLVK